MVSYQRATTTTTSPSLLAVKTSTSSTMSTDPDPYVLQPVLSDLYASRDLLDFSAPGTHHLTTFTHSPTSTPVVPTSPPKENAVGVGSLLSSVSQFAAGVTHRTGMTASPPPPGAGSSPGGPSSPRRGSGSSEHETPPERTEVRCVEGFGNNLYVGGSDGVIEWWVYDGSAGPSEVCQERDHQLG